MQGAGGNRYPLWGHGKVRASLVLATLKNERHPPRLAKQRVARRPLREEEGARAEGRERGRHVFKIKLFSDLPKRDKSAVSLQAELLCDWQPLAPASPNTVSHSIAPRALRARTPRLIYSEELERRTNPRLVFKGRFFPGLSLSPFLAKCNLFVLPRNLSEVRATCRCKFSSGKCK